MIQLHFTGYGAGFFPEFGNNSAWFADQGDFFLLDCGEDVFRKIYELPEYKQARNVYAVITHMHTDHIGSLGELAAYSWFVLKKKITIVYPDPRIRQYLTLCGIPEELYDHRTEGLDTGTVRFCPVPVVHDPCMGCYGYEIRDREETIYYGGDSQAVEEETVEKLKAGVFSRLYLDTSKHAAPDSGHGCFEVMKQRIERQQRPKVICMHLDCDFRQEIGEEGFGCVSSSRE